MKKFCKNTDKKIKHTSVDGARENSTALDLSMKNDAPSNPAKASESKRKAPVLKIVLTVLASLLLLFNILTVTVSSLGMRRSLNFLPCAFVTIESGSMEPVLSKGDLIFVWRTSFDKLKVGDIITYYSGEEFVTHGIYRIDSAEVIAKGLENNLEDSPIGENEYCARMLFSIPHGSALWDLCNETWFFIVFLCIVVFLCFGRVFFGWIFDLIARQKSSGNKIGYCRVLTCLALASTVFITPFLSSAKYKSEIGGFVISSAESIYFKSNYLSLEGNYYSVNGWAGLGTNLNLTIQNWANTLLYNETEDVKFVVRLEKIVSDAIYQESAYQVGLELYTKENVYVAYLDEEEPTQDYYTKVDENTYQKADTFTYGEEYYLLTTEYVRYTGNGEAPLPTLYKKKQTAYINDYTIAIDGQTGGYYPVEYKAGSGVTYYKQVYSDFIPPLDPEEPLPDVFTRTEDGLYHLAVYDAEATTPFYVCRYEIWNGVGAVPDTLFAQETGVYGPFTLGAGSALQKNFPIALESTRKDVSENTIPLNPGESIRFKVTAETISSQYHQTLTGVFTYNVASAASFFGESTIDDGGNSSVATYTLFTNRIDDQKHTVVFGWDTNELDINALIDPVWYYKNKDPECYQVDEETHWATLTVQLDGASKVPFQFFKLDPAKKLAVAPVNTVDNVDYINFSLQDPPEE